MCVVMCGGTDVREEEEEERVVMRPSRKKAVSKLPNKLVHVAAPIRKFERACTASDFVVPVEVRCRTSTPTTAIR